MSTRARIITAAAAAIIAIAAPLTMRSEGEVRQASLDPVNIPTLCFGHTGPDVHIGQRATADECKALLVQDLAEALAIVDRCTPGLPPYPRAALTDFALNVGPGKAGVKDGLCILKDGRMPTIRRRALAGDIPGMCRALNEGGAWSSAAGRVLPGLIKRRAAERALCEGRQPDV